MDRFGHNRIEFRRKLKTIQTNSKSEIGNNIYGYTAVISTKKCALDAVAN